MFTIVAIPTFGIIAFRHESFHVGVGFGVSWHRLRTLRAYNLARQASTCMEQHNNTHSTNVSVLTSVTTYQIPMRHFVNKVRVVIVPPSKSKGLFIT